MTQYNAKVLELDRAEEVDLMSEEEFKNIFTTVIDPDNEEELSFSMFCK